MPAMECIEFDYKLICLFIFPVVLCLKLPREGFARAGVSSPLLANLNINNNNNIMLLSHAGTGDRGLGTGDKG